MNDRSDSTRLLDTCRAKAVALLEGNLSPHGILAATPGDKAEARGYTAIFGRDAVICALGMALAPSDTLRREAATGLVTLARHQAPNGQMPKFVDTRAQEPDFWYLGCIDSTLWWLIGLALLDGLDPSRRLRETHRREIALAIQWLQAQEHQRFFLLQQNEASDWADIMPRSGFVLYTNALWLYAKRLYGIAHAEATLANANGIFHPFSAQLAEYRRARLLADYALDRAVDRELYLSFVNFSFFGDEGDVFGNLLAVLMGMADAPAIARTLAALRAAGVHKPYPIRAVCRPIVPGSFLWRRYMERHGQNFAWQYHNGGIWPMVGGFWVSALVDAGDAEAGRDELLKLARACEVNDWQFTEWLHGQTLEPCGMPGQSWNAAAFLFAEHAVTTGRSVFALPPAAGAA